METINYRNYKRGDEPGLALLFMRAFQMNGKSFIRTKRSIKWRYIQSPGFEPEMIQIAEDMEKKRIVGAIYVNPIEKMRCKGKEYLVGHINDVSCDPDYTRQGIATCLMKMAVKYMKQKGCDLAMLVTGSDSIARNKIYLKFGFQDVRPLNVYFNFPAPTRLIQMLPQFFPLFPLIILISLFPRSIIKIATKLNSFFKDVGFEICHGKGHIKYRQSINTIIPKYYDFNSKYTLKKLKWAKIDVPYEREIPSYVFIKKNTHIIGGASLTYEKFYFSQFHLILKIGIIHELYIDLERIPTRTLRILVYSYLLDKVMKAAIKRKLGIIIFSGDRKNHVLHSGLIRLGFLKLKASVLMVNDFDTKLDYQKLKKPIFLPTYLTSGHP
jgi:ribosomal protein S18 acetylase RimI-like enzyme